MDVSIIITSYNQARYLGEAIQSALEQSQLPREVIISDDGSTDDSRAVISEYRDRYPDLIKCFFNENQGISGNLNFAASQAKSDWIVFLDGDDRLLSHKIEISCAALKANSSARMAFGNFYYVDSQGYRTGLWTDDTSTEVKCDSLFSAVFAKQYPRRSLFRNELIHLPSFSQAGMFDSEMKIYEDWEFRIRFSANNQAVYSPEPLSEYRLHEEGISRVPLTDHLAYIRLLFAKNAHLLNALSKPERTATLHAFMGLESRIVRRLCKQHIQRGEFGRLRASIRDFAMFRRYAARMVV